MLGWQLREKHYMLPVVTGAYWLAKAIYPWELFQQVPITLIDITGVSPFFLTLVTLLLINGAALVVATIGWGATPRSIRHAAYYLTEGVLTFAIFGASIE